jgi:hypothetical protein
VGAALIDRTLQADKPCSVLPYCPRLKGGKTFCAPQLTAATWYEDSSVLCTEMQSTSIQNRALSFRRSATVQSMRKLLVQLTEENNWDEHDEHLVFVVNLTQSYAYF